MVPGIQISKLAVSPETDDDEQDEKSPEDNIGVGRSYECNFCKRGFTNAQALGGHMNIHRKDKAKAKKKNIQDEQPSTRIENYSHLIYNIPPHHQIPSFDHLHHQFLYQQRLNYYMSIGGEQANYKMYLPTSNPSLMQGLHRDGYDHENLSLNIGLMPYVDVNHDGTNERESAGVDLELRLGHKPK